MPTVRIITLGCAKNDVDSEEIAGVLREAGYEIDGQAERVDVTVINTCGFLQAAREEGLGVIREAVKEKKKGRTGKVIVAGCLAQRMGPEIAKTVPGADAYVGVGQMARFANIVGGANGVEITPPQHRWADVPTRARAGAPWSAYLKVSEGCDHKCTFCTIPSFRGPHESKPIERVIAEANHLASTGARELNLIAQDVTQYGYDLYREFTLPRLLRELSDVDGVDWIRLLYFYPNRLTDEVIEAMATLPKVLEYIDIPLQHVHPDILRAMKRPWDGGRYLKLFEKLRAAMPDCAIRTTFIVGFPGETEERFDSLISFMQEARLDRVGAFMYSPESGTPSAKMPGQIPEKVKKARFDSLMRAQQAISLEKNQSWVGRSMRVLVEGFATVDGEQWTAGRSHRDAPEIDGLVFVEGTDAPGEMIEVEVTGAAEYDLYARPLGRVRRGRPAAQPLRVSQPVSPR